MKRFVSIFLIITMLFSLTACGKDAPTWQEQYDLGMRYISEGKYEEAILAFEAAIAIDPMRMDAYIKAAEACAANGDGARAAELLRKGYDTIGDEWLLQLANDYATHEYYTAGLETDGGAVKAVGEHLTLMVSSDGVWSVGISGVSLKDSYTINLADSDKDSSEYYWSVSLFSGEQGLSVSTSSWAFAPGNTEERRIRDMQHSIWEMVDSWKLLGDAAMSYTSDSIGWTFTLPADFAFDPAAISSIEVEITDISRSLNFRRSYTVEQKPAGTLPDVQPIGGAAEISAEDAELLAEVVDENGNVIRRNYFNADGSLNSYTEHQYNEDGECIRTDAYQPDGTLTDYTVYYSSEDGLREYSDQYWPDGSFMGRGVAVTDEQGKWLYSARIDESGQETSKSVAVFDESGSSIGWDNYDENGNMTNYVRFEDERTVYYNADGTVDMYME